MRANKREEEGIRGDEKKWRRMKGMRGNKKTKNGDENQDLVSVERYRCRHDQTRSSQTF